ncbi:general transcription factor IIE (TFIIE) subunit, putative [Ixodes scapularis]|uniref:General transcription factor IIH subunit 1 n=1 Tax=Ixodes scapularis TaxID=6945 RepID=B7Q4R8_IXOSC|nr:general transcription factor IIE (TFIIE) subunit, putative [Ixodes scapularis]|eukprot:XP_002411606.1 general transcription factor IIE (TFIIE) subunit, putative [Ixodes scapularis]
MGTSSEDVLLMVGNVRYKKNNGTLYLMAERIAWMLEGKDTFPVSHKYADVKMQKISPEGKAKVQLQVVLHGAEGSATTFHFVNPLGTRAQLDDRNSVKELLQQLLPKFKRTLNSDLEEKNRMLQEDPRLFELYRSLVVSRVVTPEEFWANHAPVSDANGDCSLWPAQPVGVSAAFLVDVQPQTDGSEGLKYNLTADIIDSVFRTYPAGTWRKHLENVPERMTEAEFWTRFFQSHYFHRDRLHTATRDLFSDCARSDDQDVREALAAGLGDPLVDISSFQDVNSSSPCPVGVQGRESPNWQGAAGATANQSMIRRFNHHSMMVLRACGREGAPGCAADPAAKKVGPLLARRCQCPCRHLSAPARLWDRARLEDLEGVTSSTGGATVRLGHGERHQRGPTPGSNGPPCDGQVSAQALRRQLAQWIPSGRSMLPASAALSVLGELSPGGSLMKNAQQMPLKGNVELQRDLRRIYVAQYELLRHFWTCFPTTSAQLEDKVVSMRATLERFQYAQLQPFRDRLLREHHCPDLADHLDDLLQAAYAKYSSWQSRRLSLGRK